MVLQGRNNGRWWFPWGAIWWQNQWNRNRYHFLSQMVDGIIFSAGAVDHGHSLHQSVECCAQPRLPNVAATKITRCQEPTSRHWHFDVRAMLSLFSWAFKDHLKHETLNKGNSVPRHTIGETILGICLSLSWATSSQNQNVLSAFGRFGLRDENSFQSDPATPPPQLNG